MRIHQGRRGVGGALAMLLATALSACAPPSDEQLAESVEKGMMNAPGAAISFTAMKKEFPRDYRVLVGRLVKLAKTNAGEDEVRAEALPFISGFIARLAPDAKKAPGPELHEFRAAQVKLLHTLERQSPDYCATIAMGGNLQQNQAGPAQQLAIGRAQAAYFAAAGAGRRSPVTRGEPSDADFAALRAKLVARGLSEDDIALLGSPAQLNAAAPATQCRIAIVTYSAIGDLPDASAERLIPVMMLPET